MPNDKRGKLDRDRINVNDPREVRGWTKHFGVTEEILRDYVQKYGTDADTLEEHLKLRGLPKAASRRSSPSQRASRKT